MGTTISFRKKRTEKEKNIDLQTELLLLLKKLFDMGLHISKEFIDVPKPLVIVLFNSEAQYIDKKIRMYVEKLPSGLDFEESLR